MSIKPYAKPYNILQYIKLDEYITISELSKKTNISVSTIKKQLTNLRDLLSGTGYEISSCNKGIKLIRGDSVYIPVDLIFFHSQEYDFIIIYMQFILSGLSDYAIFNKLFKKRFYSDRQIKYFFKLNMNMTFSEFKEKSKFEYFTIFVEYCAVWFNCRNIKKIFDDYIKIEELNEILLSYSEKEKISAFDYLIIYAIFTFEKINSISISREYQQIQIYFEQGKYIEGVQYFKQEMKFTQNFYINDSMINYYCEVNGLTILNKNLDLLYKKMQFIATELEQIQYELSSKIVSYKAFNLTLVYEANEYNLAVIIGALKKNYPNISISCIPSWLFLYGELKIEGLIFSNTIIRYDIEVIGHRDKQGNYSLNLRV
ncbi:winged helix-turn-helix domain-containing protein [Mollicutes bacterium LVI A0039]|nr:winged helix-turn-helix domain-containing protein [Mollicutes bacterium LVI A0039]